MPEVASRRATPASARGAAPAQPEYPVLVFARDEASGPSAARMRLPELASSLADDGSLVWVDLLAPTSVELAAFGRAVGIHPTEIEDAIAPLERPKASVHDGHTSFVVYALTPRGDVAAAMAGDTEPQPGAHAVPAADAPDHKQAAGEREDALDRVLEGMSAGTDFGDALFEHTRVSGFVFPGGLVTVRSSATFGADAVRTRWDDMGDIARLGPYGLVQGLLDLIVDMHFDAVQFLDDRIEGLEDDLFTPEGRLQGFQRRAYALRKELVSLRRAVLPMRDVLNVLWRRGRGGDAPGHGLDAREGARLDALFSDLMDHALRAGEWTESLRDMVSTVFETHLSLQDQHLNEVMKKLAGWAAVISVPTLVTGWFGMNVPYPGHDTAPGLVVATTLTIVPAVVLYLVLRRLDWL